MVVSEDKKQAIAVIYNTLRTPNIGRENIKLQGLDETLVYSVDGKEKLYGDYLMERGAIDVRTAVIVSKDIPRDENALQQADWVGFSCPNLYLVGYGLDSHELYRNLPYIGVLED